MLNIETGEAGDEQAFGVSAKALRPFLEAVGPIAVVDLETTGLTNHEDAEILEFGAVLLDLDGAPVRTASSLVRPRGPLPLAIRRLTGLRDEDVAEAPLLDELREEILEILAGRTLIAHNAPFERSFLSRQVDPKLADVRYLDTQDLLALTHPDAPDLRLESFTRLLLETEEQHRALSDALDTARVLSRVAEGAAAGVGRYATARRALDRYVPESPWAALLGAGLHVASEDSASPFVAIGESAETKVAFDEASVAEALDDAERGARHFHGYRVRSEQGELARNFFRNLEGGGALLIEGGTGVGKSLAYLAAVIPFAMERAAGGVREPIVISTRTKLLQDQLLEKDIPAAARMLGYPKLRALSIKGRANYACARRFERVLDEGRQGSIFEEDRYAWAVLMACVKTRPFGEIGAIPAVLLRRYPPLRDLLRRSVASRPEHCSREECARRPDCPFGQRRAALANAHVVVANHDLLLRWPPDYPPFTHAIVDEGHELVGVADEVYAITVRPDEIIERIDEIFGRPLGRDRGDGLLARGARRRAEKDARSWRRALLADLMALGRLLSEEASDYGEIDLPEGASERHPEAAKLAETAAQRLFQVADEADRLDAEARDKSEGEEGASAVERVAEDLREAGRGLRIAFADRADVVSAFEALRSPYDHWQLSIRAVSPAESFHEAFLSRLESFAAVSASLFVGGDVFASLGELEIADRSLLPVTEVSVPSPFPYADHMRFLALKQLEGDLVEETTAVIADLARRLEGRTLGLFTSLRRMNQVAERLSEELRSEGFEVLTPRRASDSPAALVERFRRSRGGAVLLGARTFWQGLDIPGSDLQAVVIEKLPFEVPTELRRRREERIRETGANPFSRFTMGKMLLHLKQMIGRLIRSEDDRGVVVVVDARPERRYFRQLSRALPPGVPLRVGRREMAGELLDELGLGRQVDGE